MTNGAVAWSFTGGGSSTTVSATIANVNGQPFYLARVPFETRFAGNLAFTPAPNTLPLTAAPTKFTFSKADRGRVERADLLVNLPLDPALDSDGDGVPDWAELIAGTDPNDPNSVFKASTDIQPAPGGGLIIKWSSVAGRAYSLHRATNLAQGFAALTPDLPATAPENQFTDPTATNAGPYFYRISIVP